MKLPAVSIGIPVRNGEPFLTTTLEALLAQTMEDFEIVVCDNASSDATPQIAQEFAKRDSRVRYFRTEQILRPADNHNRAFHLSRGKYFKWAAHDDVHGPTFLERCLEVLERDPTTVLAYPRVAVIDSQGRHLHDYTYKLKTDAPDAPSRFGALVRANHRIHGAFEIYGLMRSEALHGAGPQGNYPRADSALLARLALRGKFREIPEILFFSREHQTRSVRQVPSHVKNGRTRLHKYIGAGPVPPLEWWDPSKKGVIDFPEWKIAKEYLVAVRDAPIDIRDRLLCLLEMLHWLVMRWPKLGRDLLIAAEQLLVGPPKAAQA
jgi:glycosyltransferase involved in cell wall biosynthesis